MDEQKALLQGLWRKAMLQDEPVEVPCKTASNATRLRFSLYNAVRDVRSGKAEVDKALRQAVDNCSIGFSPDDKSILVIQKKVMTDLMQTISGLVGDDPMLKKSPEDLAMEASQSKLMEKLQAQSETPTPSAAALGQGHVDFVELMKRKGQGNG